ncbi:hypothetical protein HMPREF2767_01440 [Nosocomiicoccus sp. HMSC067E10]|uniref:ABC transporter permease n=1 Tax=Nosocomiicoccus sp. HMSC067E10 TaxID=1739271 RepID=UPI0008A4C23A|nr:ABC transporter permease [Nosocomiicoccus sp. HMSC067E10]OFL49114.1 hypothetical protein HMPREF2767_01440 [Nosocomiicoccus sp. HMSC067E10]
MKIAFKELKYYKFKYLMIGIILFLLAFLVMFVSSLAQGLGKDNISMIESLSGEAILIEDDSNNEIQQSVLSEDVVNDARDNGYKSLSMTPLRFENNDSVQLVYTDAVNLNIVEGSQPNGKDEILVDSTMAASYNVGDTVEVKDSDITYKISGFVKRQMYAHTPIAFTTKEGFEKIKEADVNIMVGSDEFKADGITTITKKDLMNGIPSYQAEQLPLNLMIVFLFVISAIVISAFFYVITIQKTKEYGILKAIGTKNIRMVSMIVTEVFVIVILSTLIAIGLTYLLSTLLPVTMPFFVNNKLVVLLFGSFMVVSLIGALLSVIKVVKIDPLTAIGGD